MVQPWGGLAGPRRRKPAAGGETVARWVSALSRRLGLTWSCWGGVWDVSLGARGPPAAAITHQYRPGTEQSGSPQGPSRPQPPSAGPALPRRPLPACNLASPRLSFPLAK